MNLSPAYPVYHRLAGDFFTVHLRKAAAYVKSICKRGTMTYSHLRDRKHNKTAWRNNMAKQLKDHGR